MTDKETPVVAIFFQNEANNIPSQNFVMMNIFCNLRLLPIITFALEGKPTKLLAESLKKMPVAAILFSKMRPKIFPGKILWL